MKPILLLLCGALMVGACQQTPPTSVTRQEAKIDHALKELVAERRRLHTLRDSLDIKVAQNIELGMTAQQARAVETALIEVQKTVVTASETNLQQQRELLALLKTPPK
jgi:hypothetical protein